MLAQELIVGDIPPLAPKDPINMALDLMDEFKVTHMAVVDNGKLVGMVSELELLDLDGTDSTVADCPTREQVSVHEYDHIFEVVKRVCDHRLTVVPVARENMQYLGSISIAQLMTVIADLPMIQSPGGIIVLEMNIRDYTLSEIARIVENNDARILGTYITGHPDTTKMQVTVKINRKDLQGILQTFDRYDYTVTASYDQSEYREDLKDRFDMLMNYINM